MNRMSALAAALFLAGASAAQAQEFTLDVTGTGRHTTLAIGRRLREVSNRPGGVLPVAPARHLVGGHGGDLAVVRVDGDAFAQVLQHLALEASQRGSL